MRKNETWAWRKDRSKNWKCEEESGTERMMEPSKAMLDLSFQTFVVQQFNTALKSGTKDLDKTIEGRLLG